MRFLHQPEPVILSWEQKKRKEYIKELRLLLKKENGGDNDDLAPDWEDED